MSPTVRRHLIVTGRVQGVFFRASIQEKAANESVAGWAANLGDGSVEVVLEGPDGAVDEVVGYCRTGPVSARVDSVTVADEYPEGLAGFTTR
jgi:acylphosphatase